MKTEEIAALRTAAQAHFGPDGRQYKYGASDRIWKNYRTLATPANILSLLARLDTQQKELGEQEVAALAWAKESEELKNLLRVSEGYREAYRKAKLALYEASEGNEPMMDALIAHMPCSEGALERAVTRAVGRIAAAPTLEPAPVSACLQECSSCQKVAGKIEVMPRRGQWWKAKNNRYQRALITGVGVGVTKPVYFKATGMSDAKTLEDVLHRAVHSKHLRTFLRDYELENEVAGSCQSKKGGAGRG